MSNIKTSISNHNRRLLEQQIVPPSTGCNCRTLNECPLNGKCLTESLVYQAEITSTDAGEAKTYIGMTGGSFKKRYANHKKPINNPRYSSETIGSPESRVFILVALARVSASNWFNIMTRLASFYRK